mmetsp:Transcript_14261/g.21068  ORF Transcript_14261/g.21068 Transcript_14261/m.21068 type:complete len:366 (+) Transcript_14261:82-1179(+)
MKRDRWDSSSEDEHPHTTGTPSEGKKIKGENKEHRTLRSHNPLLSGCRSVYSSYERLARLSEGAFGIVWKAKDLATQEIVALKQIKFDADMVKEGFPISALREINVLLSLNHECVVTVREMVVGTALDKVFMVMEFMEMDLKDAMGKTGNSPFSQSELKGMMFQILSGIEHIHNKWMLHRDLKTSNILVHRSGRIALADFGLARKYQHPLKALTQMVITLWYRPPELLFGETVYGPAVDMWSIGCIFGELIIKDAILQGQGELDQIDKIFTLVGAPDTLNWPKFDKLPSSGILRWKSQKSEKELSSRFPVNRPLGGQTFLDISGFDLLQKLLTLNPKTRITAASALQHNYFKGGVKKAAPRFYFN